MNYSLRSALPNGRVDVQSTNSLPNALAPRSQWGEDTGETAADYDRGFNDPAHAFADY